MVAAVTGDRAAGATIDAPAAVARAVGVTTAVAVVVARVGMVARVVDATTAVAAVVGQAGTVGRVAGATIATVVAGRVTVGVPVGEPVDGDSPTAVVPTEAAAAPTVAERSAAAPAVHRPTAADGLNPIVH